MTSNPNDTSTPERIRLRFTLRQLMLAFFFVSVGLGIWTGWLRKVVAIRPARNEDRLYEDYLGISHDEARVRNIAVVTGTFTKNTWLTARLLAVRSGQCKEVNSFTVGRTSNAIGSLPWETMKITLALGMWDTPAGPITHLGSAGHTRGGGYSSFLPVDINGSFASTYTGSIRPGREYVIYAEGDTEVALDGVMTAEEFTQRHSGNHLIVTAQLQ